MTNLLVEISARIFGWVFGFYKPGHELRAEGRLRGFCIGLPLRCSSLYVGRNVLLEGINRMSFGNNVRLNHNVDVSVGSKGHFKISDNSHVGRQSVIAAAGGVTIGRGCAISSHVSIFSISNTSNGLDAAEDLPVKTAPVHILDGAFIGAGAVILPGVTIGRNATLGAGAVATADIPDGAVAVGVPALTKHPALNNSQ